MRLAIRRTGNTNNTIEQLIRGTAIEMAQSCELFAAWNILKASSAENKELSLIPKCLLDPIKDTSAWQSVGETIHSMIDEINEVGQLAIRRIDSHFVFVLPYPNSSSDSDSVNWFSGVLQESSPASARSLISMVHDHVLLGIHDINQGTLVRHRQALVDIIAIGNSLCNANSTTEACIMMANRLRQMTDSLQVVVALKQPKHTQFRIRAVSDVETFDSNSECIRIIQKAADRGAMDSDAEPLQVWHSSADSDSINQLALKNYANSQNCNGAIQAKLNDSNNQPFASLLFAISDSQAQDQYFIRFIQSICNQLGNQLALVDQAKRSPFQLLRDWIIRQKDRKWSRIAAITTVVLMLTMAIPLPYRVNCDCQVHPVKRRFVAAPFDGILDKSLVQNGDVVSAGQLLAQMDGRRLRMERASLTAERQGQKKTRDSALAKGSIAESQIALKEIERIDSEIGLINTRLENLGVRSPIAGIIVSGDLEKAEGAPLEIGQQLFEVGPLEQMLIELHIPETEIKYVRPEMHVKVRLSAFPFRTWKGTIKRIHSRAEVLDDENVFVAEVSIENPDLKLRPGMKGQAKIISDIHPIGWNWFHRSWDSVRRWTFW